MYSYPNPRKLRSLMERKWKTGMCDVPLKTACWDIVSGKLTQTISPDNDDELFEYEKTIEVLCVRHTNEEE